jgi:SAM-dependent MidA family methyltransferase
VKKNDLCEAQIILSNTLFTQSKIIIYQQMEQINNTISIGIISEESSKLVHHQPAPLAIYQISALQWYCQTPNSSSGRVIAQEWLDCLKIKNQSLGSYLAEKSIHPSSEHRQVLIKVFLDFSNYN